MEASKDPAQTSASAPIVEHDLGLWREFLSDEDLRCRDHDLHAAVVTVGLGPDVVLDDAIALVAGVLRPTDRVGVLSADELSIVLCPVQDIHEAQRIVVSLERELDQAAVPAHVGWAMRLAGHGFFHAAARADARMLTAKGHGTFSIDVTDQSAVTDLTEVTDLTDVTDLTEADAEARQRRS